jgi:hypothetical protein
MYQNLPLGKGGALGRSVGCVPGANMVARGLVGMDEAFATIEAKGTAVGFIDIRVNVTEGVEMEVEVVVAGTKGPLPDVVVLRVVDEPPVADDAWRA